MIKCIFFFAERHGKYIKIAKFLSKWLFPIFVEVEDDTGFMVFSPVYFLFFLHYSASSFSIPFSTVLFRPYG